MFCVYDKHTHKKKLELEGKNKSGNKSSLLFYIIILLFVLLNLASERRQSAALNTPDYHQA